MSAVNMLNNVSTSFFFIGESTDTGEGSKRVQNEN